MDLITPTNTDPLTLRCHSRLDQICISIIRENFVREGLIPKNAYSMRFTYKYFMPNYFNFVQIGTQEKYNDMLDNHRKAIEAS